MPPSATPAVSASYTTPAMSDMHNPSGAYASVFRPGLYAGQVVVVTGGGSGIGRCTAHELAALGAAVAMLGARAEKLAAVQAEIEAAGAVCSTHVCDIREEDAVKLTVAAVLERH